MPNVLFSEFYISLLFKFKIGLSLSLYSLMSSMFIIMRIIIRIIKTRCFEYTVSTAKLEGKLASRRWSLSAHNFPNSGYFHKNFGQIFSLIYVQTHLRAEWYSITKILYCRIFLTIQLTDKVEFQSYILNFLFFIIIIIGKQYMKTLKKIDSETSCFCYFLNCSF